jgi:hypothetical protein
LSGAFNLLVTDISVISTDSVFLDVNLFKPAMIIVANVAISDLGSPYASKLILPPLPSSYLAKVTFVLNFPASTGIQISVHQFLEGNPSLVTFTSDGSGISGNATLSFNGTAWSLTDANWNE